MSHEDRSQEDGGRQVDDAAARANRLYWGSEESVNRIADELGLSKGSLYQIVQPLPSELPCPRCGTEMAYPNRTAREKGFLTCPACEYEEDEASVREALVRGDVARLPQARPGPVETPLPGGTVDRRVLVGAALLGVAVGVVIGSRLRR